jgi:hypothetical protein
VAVTSHFLAAFVFLAAFFFAGTRFSPAEHYSSLIVSKIDLLDKFDIKLSVSGNDQKYVIFQGYSPKTGLSKQA